MAAEHAGEVSSSLLGGTSMDLSKFKSLTLNDHTPHTLESADSEIPQKDWPPKSQGDTTFTETQAEKEYAESQAQSLQGRGGDSKEEIAQNARKRMAEEAFRTCIKREDDPKGLEYVFDGLIHHCFYVEHHFEAFYHLNFTVKIKKRGSTDWAVVMYFAEVRAIRGIKHYVCYSLNPDENGQCYACRKKGMNELIHPVGVFPAEEIKPIIGYCEYSDSDDEYQPTNRESESDDDMS